MPALDPLLSLAGSLLDRLIDPESAGTRDRPGYTFDKLKLLIQRDLEDLLNTVRSHLPIPSDCQELEHSILTYGLPDLGSLDSITPKERELIGTLVGETISRHEPRLRKIQVELLDREETPARSIRYHISAECCVQ